MKIIYFVTYYAPYLNTFLERNPDFSLVTYEKQMASIIGDYFGVFGSYVKYAKRMGVDAHLIVANCAPMQKQWARENGFIYDETKGINQIAIEQIKKIGPDVFYIGSMFEYYGEFLDTIKPYCKKIVGWIACPIPKSLKLTQLNLILSSVPQMVSEFRYQGINSELLPAAFDSEIIISLPTNIKQDIDFSFVGGISKAHKKRMDMVRNLAKYTPIQLFGYGYQTYPLWKFRLKQLALPNSIEAHYKGEAWGLDMYRTLLRSRITFNAHIDMALGNRVNMRMYEATGMGTLLLTDKSDHSDIDYFVDGKEIVTYTSVQEAIEKVNYYLEHETERNVIAKAGQKRTLEQYNFGNNINIMLSYFNKYL